METRRSQKYGLFVLVVLLLGALGVGAIYYLQPPEYRVAIVPEEGARAKAGPVFRYQWPEGTIAETKGAYACLCFREGQPAPAIVSCSGRVPKPEAQCVGSLKAARNKDDYQPYENVRQISVSADHAALVTSLFQQGAHRFEAGLRPDSQGMLRVETIYIDGTAMDKFLKRYKTAQP